jgi:LCP family protein required for cell wall assembly
MAMTEYKQINRLIKKGLFDQRLKTQRQKKKKEKTLKIACLFVSSLIIIILAVFIYQLTSPSSGETSVNKTLSEQTANEENKESKMKTAFKSILPFKTEDKSPINILVLGRPGQGYAGQNLTDTIILVHLEPAEQKVVLVSLPRDLLVKIPGSQPTSGAGLTKINALYNLRGIEGLKGKIKEITGLTVDHHILIDLVVAEEVITLVDGLNVYVPQDIYDPYFPGPNHTYQTFSLAAGWRYLDGPTALKYARTRYTSPNGDFDRMARQQQIIQLLKQKVLGLNLLWDLPTYLKIFSSLRDHIETDLGLWEMKSLWQITKEIDHNQIISLVIDKKETNLLTGGLVPFGQQMASVVYPKTGQGNYQAIQEYIKKFID